MNKFSKSKSKKGFTLIELLVTIAILAIIAGVGVDMFATVMRAYRKAEVFSLLERNGSQVLTQMEQDIRSSIDAQVSGDGNSITVSIPNGAAVVQKTYQFSECTVSDGGDITVESGATPASLINKADENIVDETLYIKKIDLGAGSENFVKESFNNVYVSFLIGAGGDCANPEVEVFQQVSVNLRGGLD